MQCARLIARPIMKKLNIRSGDFHLWMCRLVNSRSCFGERSVNSPDVLEGPAPGCKSGGAMLLAVGEIDTLLSSWLISTCPIIKFFSVFASTSIDDGRDTMVP